jgi:hypothetical protein
MAGVPVAVVVVYDVECPDCSTIARELPELVRVPVAVHACRDRSLPDRYPGLPPRVRRCAAPAVGTIGRDGAVRWWPGLTGALGLLPVLRPGAAREAAELLWTAFRTVRRARRD